MEIWFCQFSSCHLTIFRNYVLSVLLQVFQHFGRLPTNPLKRLKPTLPPSLNVFYFSSRPCGSPLIPPEDVQVWLCLKQLDCNINRSEYCIWLGASRMVYMGSTQKLKWPFLLLWRNVTQCNKEAHCWTKMEPYGTEEEDQTLIHILLISTFTVRLVLIMGFVDIRLIVAAVSYIKHSYKCILTTQYKVLYSIVKFDWGKNKHIYFRFIHFALHVIKCLSNAE